MEQHQIQMSLSAVITLVVVLATCVLYPFLPELVPTHYNVQGIVDGWGAKSTIWWVVAFQVVQVLLLGLLSRYPQYYNYPIQVTDENRERLYRLGVNLVSYLALSMSILMAYALAVLLQLVPLFTTLMYLYILLALFLLPIYYIYKAIKLKDARQ